MTPPIEYRSISKPDLLRKFIDEDWETRLSPYPCKIERYTHKTTYIWKDGKTIMAIKTVHKNPQGESTVIRLLRETIDGVNVVWDIDHKRH